MKYHRDQINEIGLIETKFFHFHRIFKKKWGTGRGSSETPLDPPLLCEDREDHLERHYLCRNQAAV